MTDMNKLVWISYKKELSWKAAWEKMFRTSSFIVVLTQMCTTYPVNVLDLEGKALVYYFILLVPMVFSMFSALCVDLYLPKQMYLTPLTQAERREYMERLLRLKIMLPNVIMVIVVGVMIALRVTNIFVGILLIVQNVFTTMGMGLCYRKMGYNGREELAIEGSLVWSVITSLIGVLAEMFIIGACCRYEGVDMVALIFWGMGIVIQLLCLYKIYSRKNQYFDRMENYDS